MIRKVWLPAVTLLIASWSFGQQAAERVVLDASRALQAGNAARFLSYFDREATPDFATLRESVLSLTALKTIASSVSIVSSEAREGKVELKTDWLLQLTPAREPGPVETRQHTLAIVVDQNRKRKRIVSIEPIDFFRALPASDPSLRP